MNKVNVHDISSYIIQNLSIETKKRKQIKSKGRRRSTSDSAEAWSVRRDASWRHERSRQGLGVCELFVHRMENALRLASRPKEYAGPRKRDLFLIITFHSIYFPFFLYSIPSKKDSIVERKEEKFKMWVNNRNEL